MKKIIAALLIAFSTSSFANVVIQGVIKKGSHLTAFNANKQVVDTNFPAPLYYIDKFITYKFKFNQEGINKGYDQFNSLVMSGYMQLVAYDKSSNHYKFKFYLNPNMVLDQFSTEDPTTATKQIYVKPSINQDNPVSFEGSFNYTENTNDLINTNSNTNETMVMTVFKSQNGLIYLVPTQDIPVTIELHD